MSTFALLEKDDLVVAVFRRKGQLRFLHPHARGILTLLPNQLNGFKPVIKMSAKHDPTLQKLKRFHKRQLRHVSKFTRDFLS